MINDKYNYTLNGIEHEIILNHKIKIEDKPVDEKILVSNKYLVKYINDIFDYHSIEYSFLGNSLLGIYIFNGINIFNHTLEICILDINLIKLKKIEEEIKNDQFDIVFYENYVKISTSFFSKIKSTVYIYFLKHDLHDLLTYETYNKKIMTHKFYDIFPIKKYNFEEFEVSVPNKIENILESFGFNLNYITFTKRKDDDKKIIEEVETKPNLINNFISIIKPLIFNE